MSQSRASPALTPIVETFRERREESLTMGLLANAIFYGETLWAMDGRTTEDLYQLARAYFLTSQYNRCYKFLQENLENLEEDRVCLLAVQCKTALEEWEVILETTEGQYLTPAEQYEEYSQAERTCLAAICVCRGKAYQVLENRDEAAQCLMKALAINIYASDAFSMLMSHHMLNVAQQNRFFSSLKFPRGAEALKELYAGQLSSFTYSDHKRTAPPVWKELQIHESPIALLSVAKKHFYRNQFPEAYDITKKVLNNDPDCRSEILLVHVACLVELDLPNDLFFLSHKLVQASPKSHLTWYSVGCYYFLIGKQDVARQFFTKCTTLHPDFGIGWLAFAHSFAQEGEHDQALALYRTAFRLLGGSHIPTLCVGIEHARASNFPLANHFIQKAGDLCTFDPLINNELGVVAYKYGDIEKAYGYFQAAVKQQQAIDSHTGSNRWEPTFFNMGLCCRLLGLYEDAVAAFNEALLLCPYKASTHSALALTHHIYGDFEAAMESYQQALSLDPEDLVAKEYHEDALQMFVENAMSPDLVLTGDDTPL